MENILELITAISTAIIAIILVTEKVTIIKRIMHRIKSFKKKLNLAFRLRTIRNKIRLKLGKK